MSYETEELVSEDIAENIITNIPAKVILFNDEVHSFDDVIIQLVKAIKCSLEQAENLTWEIHSQGKACVFEGDMPECLRVSAVLEEINLGTQIEY